MDARDRMLVVKAINDVCRYKGWSLLAVHPRSNHVHAVVHEDENATPEFIMNAFKAYSSRALNLERPEQRGQTRWARHGSTRYLWSREKVDAAVRYVLEKQGEPMARHDGRRCAI